MTFKNRWLSALGILAIATAMAVVGLRVTHQDALAQTPAFIAPAGCPAAPALTTGMVAQSNDLGLPSTAGLPPHSVELSSFQWGVGRGISSPTGSSADREAGAPSVSEIHITKQTDAATPLLFRQAVQDDPTPTGWTIWDYQAKGSNGVAACMQIDLQNVLVSSVKWSRDYLKGRVLLQQGRLAGANDESLTLNFSKITMTNLSNKSSASSPDSFWNHQGEITFQKIEL